MKKWLIFFIHKIDGIMNVKNQILLFLFTAVTVAIAIFDSIKKVLIKPVGITFYTLAAIGFSLTCIFLINDIRAFIIPGINKIIKSHRVMDALSKDDYLRTVAATIPGTALNVIYAVFNGIIGIMGHSAWYGSLSAYYIVLCLMRLGAVLYARQTYKQGEDSDLLRKKELKVYRDCGILMFFMSIAFGGAVIMLVTGEGGKSYPGIMIYAVATYTFYKLIRSVINMVKVRRGKSLLLIALRNIGYADALVSLLSLQSALFAAFGQEDGDIISRMNAMTGIAVCLMMLIMGINMVRVANSMKKKDNTKEC